MKYDVVIIGGGVIGMLSALRLAERGRHVLLLERERLGSEASWAGGGILSPLYPWRYPKAVVDLAMESDSEYRTLATQLAHAGCDPELIESGLLVLDSDEFSSGAAWAREQGRPSRVLEGQALYGRAPVARHFEQALELGWVGQVRNPRLLQGLRKALSVVGVAVREECEAECVAVTEGRVSGVIHAAGKVRADAVVVAAGAWSAQVIADLMPAFPVMPVKGQMLLLKAVPDALGPILLFQGRYMIPRRDGQILVGSTVEKGIEDKAPTSEAEATLRASALAMCPSAQDWPVVRHWAGLRPAAPQGIPFIGEHPDVRGLWFNTGHFRNGLCTAPASARLLTDLMLERVPAIAPEPYAVFAERHRSVV